MKTKELKNIWGEELFIAFGKHINEDGWLTAEWAQILEENFSNWDEDYNDTNEKSRLYSRMYNIDFEENEDGTLIRRTDYTFKRASKLADYPMENQITISKEVHEELVRKAAKWDSLRTKIARFYEEDNNDGSVGDLCDIGEVAASAFGYL